MMNKPQAMRENFIFLLIIAIVFLIGCSKEGPEGPQGPSGNGTTIEVMYFPNPPPSDWPGSGTTGYSTTIVTPSITDDVLLNGIVNVYWYEVSANDTTFMTFPFDKYLPLPIVTFQSSISTEAVTISSHVTSGFHQDPGLIYPGTAFGIRVVTIQ